MKRGNWWQKRCFICFSVSMWGEKWSWEGDLKDSLVGMQLTHSRAIRNVETPGAEGSITRGRQTLPAPSGSQKHNVCQPALADSLMPGLLSKDQTGEKGKEMNEMRGLPGSSSLCCEEQGGGSPELRLVLWHSHALLFANSSVVQSTCCCTNCRDYFLLTADGFRDCHRGQCSVIQCLRGRYLYGR